MKRSLCVSTLMLISVVVGCSDANQSEAPIPEVLTAALPQTPGQSAAGDSAEPVTYLDSEALREGSGLMDDDAPKEFQTTESGLRYRVLRNSDGPKPTADQTVTVHYRGWLDNGTEFDSSYSRGETISFPLRNVIPGWTEGMQLVGVGGMIELWIAPELGYGERGAGAAVPPNATLHFIVELLEIN